MATPQFPGGFRQGRRAPVGIYPEWIQLAGVNLPGWPPQPKISPQARFAWSVIRAYVANADDPEMDNLAIPGQELIGLILDKAQNTVSGYVKELVALGAVEATRQGQVNGSYLYLVHDTPPEGYTGFMSFAQFNRYRARLRADGPADAGASATDAPSADTSSARPSVGTDTGASADTDARPTSAPSVGPTRRASDGPTSAPSVGPTSEPTADTDTTDDPAVADVIHTVRRAGVAIANGDRVRLAGLVAAKLAEGWPVKELKLEAGRSYKGLTDPVAGVFGRFRNLGAYVPPAPYLAPKPKQVDPKGPCSISKCEGGSIYVDVTGFGGYRDTKTIHCPSCKPDAFGDQVAMVHDRDKAVIDLDTLIAHLTRAS